MAVSIHGNNGVVTTNGTAAAPSLAAPDTDTGLYFGTNLIHASTDGTVRLSIIADGKVGIGTDNPSTSLQVDAGAVSLNSLLKTTSASSLIGFQHNAGSSYTTRIGSKTLGAGNVGLAFDTGTSGGSTKMIIDVNGKVGIGTETPTKLLELKGTDPTIKLMDSSGDAYALIEGDFTDQGSIRFRADPTNVGGSTHIRFDTDGSQRLHIDSVGNMGLGGAPIAPGHLTFHMNNSTSSAATRFHMTTNTTGATASDGFSLSIDGSSSAVNLIQRETADMIFYTAGSPRLRIDSSGRLLIGRTSGSFAIDAQIGSDSTFRMSNSGETGHGSHDAKIVAGGSYYQNPNIVGSTIKFSTYNGSSEGQRMAIMSNGVVNIGSGQLDQTDRMLNVYGGRMRISGIPNNSNSFELYASATTGQSHGMMIQAGTNASDINSTFRNTSGATLFRIRGDGNIGVGVDAPSNNVEIRTAVSGEGLTIKSTGSTSNTIYLDANRSGANNGIGQLAARWNGTTVAQMSFMAGDNTTHKNDGYIWFGTETAAANGNVNATERVRIAADGNVGIGEDDPQTKLNVKGCISTGRNLAREVGTIINISSSYSGTRNGVSVISGQKNYEENTNGDWITANGQRANANLTIDLGAQYTCDRFVIYNQNEYSNNVREVKRFTLEGSNDNSSWTTILDDEAGASYAHEPNPGWSFHMPANNFDDDEGVTYRYWKFTMKTYHGSTTLGGVMELELYEASNVTTSEITSHSVVATDIYARTIHHEAPAFFACRDSSFSIPNESTTLVQFVDNQGPGFDTNNCWDNSNYRFVPNVPGYYSINMLCSVSYGSLRAGRIFIFKNGSQYAMSQLYLNSGDSYDDISMACSTLVYMNGSGDYIDGRAWRNGGSGGLGDGWTNQQISGFLARSAGPRRHGDGVA